MLAMTAALTYGQGLTFRQVTIADGLNNGTIKSIEQDSLGRLWLATTDGLMQYDGYRVINHKPILGDVHSIPGKVCVHLSIDSRKNLWVSTTRGLCRYDPALNRFLQYTFEGLAPEFPVRTEILENSGKMLVRVGSDIYYLPADQVDSLEFRYIQIIGAGNRIINRDIRYLFANDERILLCFRMRDLNNNWITEVYNGSIKNDSIIRIDDQYEFLVPGNVRDIKVNGKRVYMGTDEGFAVYDYDHRLLTWKEEFQGFRVRVLLEDSDGYIWLGTDRNGLIRYHPATSRFEQYEHDPNSANTILGNNIFSLYEDFSGNLMIGHGGEGITVLNLKDKQFTTYRYDPRDPGSIGDNTVFCFSEFDGGLLAGTRNKGLFHMHTDPGDGKAVFSEITIPQEFMKEVDAPAVWCLEKESDNLYWIGTTFGLIKAELQEGQWKFSKYYGDVTFRSIYIDMNGNIWLGSYQGLYVVPAFRKESMDPLILTDHADDPSALSDQVITAFLLDGNDHFWIGTENGGINRLVGNYSDLNFDSDLENQLKFMAYNASTASHTLNNEEINILYEHTNGEIWAGTKGGGINILDQATNRFRALTVEDGLPGNNVYGILPDNQGRLWLSTNKGLSSYDPFNHKFSNYTPSDGIQGNVFMNNSYYKSEEGKLYFGGRNGFTGFFPDEIINNEVMPKFHFSGIGIQGNVIHIGDTLHNQVLLPESLSGMSSISLSYRERSFDVLFSAIHFQYPEDNLVEYFLEGFDERPTVINASVGRITFNNLDNGQYQLRVRAANSDNVWTPGYRTLEINILPPWYKTRWAVGLFILLGVTLLAGLIRLLLHRQSLAHELKIEKIEKRNLREFNEAKLRFFTNVSHEFRTPLCLTVGPIDNLLRERETGDYRLRHQLGLASRNAKLLLRLVDQIIDFRRLEAGKTKLQAAELDMNAFINLIIENFEPLRKEKEVGLFVNFPDDPIHLWIDPQKVEQIVYNLLSNAFKHVPREGSIVVTLNRTDHIPGQDKSGSWAQISVYNDGKTIPESDLTRVFERFFKVDDAQMGSGIGLAYARSLVDLHRGHINVENRQESGVVFNVYLPRGKRHLREEELASDDQVYAFPELTVTTNDLQNIPARSGNEKQPLSLLVVEDNDELREFFRTLLADRYQFHEAPNGSLGYEIAKEVVPDIIISDLLMPEMNGFELCDNLKQNETTSHIPIILLTAKNTPEDKITGYKSGADAYVVKPFEISVLEAQITRLIENRAKLQEKFNMEGKEQVGKPEILTREDHFVNRVRDLIEKDLQDPELNVNKLSEKINLSSTQLYRKIKAVTGQSSVDFIKDFRLVKSAALLKSTDHSVKEICFMTGFKSPSYFVKCFKVKYGVTPKEYASNGSGSSTVLH